MIILTIQIAAVITRLCHNGYEWYILQYQVSEKSNVLPKALAIGPPCSFAQAVWTNNETS